MTAVSPWDRLISHFAMSRNNSYKNKSLVRKSFIKMFGVKLPSKKRIVESDMDYEVFVVDTTETLIERPMIKNKVYTKDKNKLQNLKKK